MHPTLSWSGLTLAALVFSCGSETDGPVGAPGGRNGVELLHLTPRSQFVTTEAPSRVALTLEARQREDGVSVPLANVLMKAVRRSGKGELAREFATTDSRGVVSFEVLMPAIPNRTEIAIQLDTDRTSFLAFEVVGAPVTPIDMEVGDIREIDGPRDGHVLRFDLESQDRYVLIPFQTQDDRSGAQYRFVNQAVDGTGGALLPIESPSLPVRPQLPSSSNEPVEAGAIDPGRLKASGIPERVRVRSCRIDSDRTAPLRHLGRHIAIYVDTPEDSYQARIDSIGRDFDENIFPLNTELFGPTTDFDGNGVVLVVMSPELQQQGGIYCDSVRAAGVEAFYAIWTPEDPIDRPLATLAHEHQHVINAGHHLPRGDIGDERWINEGMSYAAEGLHGYWAGSLVRMWKFLSGQNGGLSMLPFEYSVAFDEKYMMFMLYLRDRFGDGTWYAMGVQAQVGRSGIPNIEDLTNTDFDTLVKDWFIANAVSNSGLTSDPRYNYRSVDFEGMLTEILGCNCLPNVRFSGMTKEPLPLGISFNVFRTLDRIDADYYQLVPRPGSSRQSYDLLYHADGQQTVRLIVIRTK